jgi:hypothetical protein
VARAARPEPALALALAEAVLAEAVLAGEDAVRLGVAAGLLAPQPASAIVAPARANADLTQGMVSLLHR